MELGSAVAEGVGSPKGAGSWELTNHWAYVVTLLGWDCHVVV